MGVNDAGEMLVVAKAECVRLEAENARLHAEVEVAYNDRDAALERLGLEVAGRVELAAVIEKAKGVLSAPIDDDAAWEALGRILAAAPADVLRARDAEKWDEGHGAGWQARSEDWEAGYVPSGPWESDAVNPYREVQS